MGNYTQTSEYKNKWKDKNFTQNFLNNLNTSKRRNNTFNTSKYEDMIFEKLKTKFSNIEMQYKTNMYPFLCDLYIADLDLYIELNFHWSHGSKPYMENDNECIVQLKKWKEKSLNSKFYKNAIETWTIRDPSKRKTVKENNLNWIEFFTLDEFNKWFESVFCEK